MQSSVRMTSPIVTWLAWSPTSGVERGAEEIGADREAVARRSARTTPSPVPTRKIAPSPIVTRNHTADGPALRVGARGRRTRR